MRKWLIRTCVAFAVTCVACVVYVLGEAWYWQVSIGEPLERVLGFQCGSPYIRDSASSGLQEVLTVESVVPGGVFDRAGFKSGDVVRGLSTNELFQVLHRGRGREVTVRVVQGGDGPALDQRPQRSITFEVPRDDPFR